MKILKTLVTIVILAALAVIISNQFGIYDTLTVKGKLGSNTLVNHSLCKTAAATSTLSTIANSSGAAIVLTCDAYHTDANIYEATPIDFATLAVQYTAASTTDSTLKIVLSYSQDGSDWYNDNLVSDESMASTTILVNLNTSTTTKYLFDVETPVRYVRASFTNTLAATSSVWAEFIPQKQVNK